MIASSMAWCHNARQGHSMAGARHRHCVQNSACPPLPHQPQMVTGVSPLYPRCGVGEQKKSRVTFPALCPTVFTMEPCSWFDHPRIKGEQGLAIIPVILIVSNCPDRGCHRCLLSIQTEVDQKIACMMGTCSAEDYVVYQGWVSEEVRRWTTTRGPEK